MKLLSRRRFLSFAGMAALLATMPLSARALVPTQLMHASRRALRNDKAWEIIETGLGEGQALQLTGHVKKTGAGDYILSRTRHHCDYCYTGHAASVLHVKNAGALSEGAQVTLSGTLRGKHFICEKI